MPDIFETATKETRNYFEAGFKAVKDRLKANDIPLTEWNRARQNAIQQEIATVLRDMTAQVGTISEPFVNASYITGLGEGKISADWSRIAVDQVNAIAKEMSRSLTDGVAQIGRWVDDGLRQAQLQALTENQIQGLGLAGQKKRFLEIMEQQRLSMPRGFKGDIGQYAEMVTRTNLAEANRIARINRSLERGYTLVEIPEHGATDTCAPWEGAIISLVPNNDGIPTFDQVRMLKGTHIFGPNCRHESLTPVSSRLFSEEEKQAGIEKAIAAYRKFGGSISGYKEQKTVEAKSEIDKLVKKAKAKKPTAKSFKTFTNKKEMDQWGEDNFRPAKEAFNDKEYNALVDYKTTEYIDTNDWLRSGDRAGIDEDALPAIKERIKQLDSAMKKSVVPEDITLFRGSRVEYDDEDIGNIFVEEGYMSTSLNKKFVKESFASGGSLLEIKVPKGHNAIWIDDKSIREESGLEEWEVLLKRDTKYKLLGKKKESGITKYILEVINE